MPDFTVAQHIDDFMKSSNKAIALSGLGATPAVAPTVVEPTSTYTLAAPVGTFVAGDKQIFYITPDGNRDFNVSNVLVPSDSLVTLPKTLNDGELYIVQITYSGSFWMLTSLVGGYS